MSKVIDITDKLNFEENPVLKVKDVELEIDASAENMLKVMGLVSDNPTAKDVEEMCQIIFTPNAQKKLSSLTLNFKDYQTVVMAAINVATGNDVDEEAGE